MPEQTAATSAAVPDQLTGAAGDGELEPIEIETAGRHQQSDIVDADVVDADVVDVDVVDVDVVDAEVLESPTVAAPLKRIGRRSGLVLPDPQTDEWHQAQVAETSAVQPPSQPPPAQSPPAAEWASTAISQATEIEVPPRGDLVRPGPSILEADTWTVNPDDTPNSDYHGRRRADTTGRRRVLVVAALALIFVIGSIGVVLLLNSGSTPEATGPGGSSLTDDPLYSDAPVTTTEGELAPPSSSPGASLTASPKPTTAATTTASVIPGATTTPPTATPTPTLPASPPFTPIKIQAESGSMTSPSFQRAGSQCGSEGDVVRVGRWWNGNDYRVYMLTFHDVTVPAAGTYTMTVHYISGASPSTRTVQLTVNGVPVATPSFPRSTCVTTKSFEVSLNAGSNQVAFTNEDDRAPTLDRIVISRP